MTAISDKYATLGGAAGFLGPQTGPEALTPGGGGAFQHFQSGSIYWSPQTGAHEVHGVPFTQSGPRWGGRTLATLPLTRVELRTVSAGSIISIT